MQDSAISVLAEAMMMRRKTGFIVFRSADRRYLTRACEGFQIQFAMPRNRSGEAEEAARALLDQGCEQIVLWQTAASLQEFTDPGELVMPTRVVDAESGERYDTAIARMGRRDRAAVLSAGVVYDPGTRKRLAMRFQCVVMDTCAAILARMLERSNVPFFVVCTQIDRRADHWTNRILSWRLRFSRGNPLRHLGWLLFKPKEIHASLNSRSEAEIALRDAASLLREFLDDFQREALEEECLARTTPAEHQNSAVPFEGGSAPAARLQDPDMQQQSSLRSITP